jgi:signal transduction histidine kinase
MTRTFISIFLGLLITALVVALSYRAAKQTFERNLLSEHSLAAERMDVLFGGVQLAAQIVAAEARRKRTLTDLDASFDIVRSAFPEFRTVITIDPTGVVQADLRQDAPARGLNVSDRDYFRAHLERMTQGLFVGAAVVSRIDQRLSFPISVPLRDETGDLFGVVVSSVDERYFRPAYEHARTHVESELFLAEPGGGVVIALASSGAITPQRIATAEATFSDVLEAAPAAFHTAALLRSEDRLLAVGSLPSSGFLLIDILPPSSVTSHALSAAAGPGALVLLFAAAVTLMVYSSGQKGRRDRARMEEINDLRERLAIAVEAGRIGIWAYDPGKGAITWNDRMFEIYGLPSQSGPIDYRVWERRVHPDDLKTITQALQTAVDGDEFRDTRFRIIIPAGDIRYVEARAARSVRDGSGKVRIIGVNLDVTDQVETEVDLKQAMEAAIKANHAKSHFLASMSHNLRTPLNAVLGYGQLLALDPRGRLGSKEKEYAGHVVDAGTDLLDLVNDILDLMLLEAGQVAIQPEPFDIHDALAECVSQIKPSCDASGLTMDDSALDAAGVSVTLDRRRFKQIVVNLLTNAVRYNRPQGKITVWTDRSQRDCIRVIVEDTGVGIAEEDQDRIFEKFERLREDPTVASEGVGIGLTISRMLAERMGVTLDFSSRKGHGSRFWIDLPLKPARLRSDDADPPTDNVQSA